MIKGNSKFILLVAFFVSTTSVMATEIFVTVKGMVCSFCAQGIEKQLRDEAGVKSVSVNLGEMLVHISTEDGKDLSDKVLGKTISDAGFHMEKVERK